MIAAGLTLTFLALIGVWIVCLVEVLSGNGLETFRLGSVTTVRTALSVTYLEVLIGDSLVAFAILGASIAQYLKHREEVAFLEKHQPRLFSDILRGRRRREAALDQANDDARTGPDNDA